MCNNLLLKLGWSKWSKNIKILIQKKKFWHFVVFCCNSINIGVKTIIHLFNESLVLTLIRKVYNVQERIRLTQFMPLVSFYTPWKHHKMSKQSRKHNIRNIMEVLAKLNHCTSENLNSKKNHIRTDHL